MKFNLAAKLQFYFTRLNNYIVFSFEKSSINCLSFKYFLICITIISLFNFQGTVLITLFLK